MRVDPPSTEEVILAAVDAQLDGALTGG